MFVRLCAYYKNGVPTSAHRIVLAIYVLRSDHLLLSSPTRAYLRSFGLFGLQHCFLPKFSVMSLPVVTTYIFSSLPSEDSLTGLHRHVMSPGSDLRPDIIMRWLICFRPLVIISRDLKVTLVFSKVNKVPGSEACSLQVNISRATNIKSDLFDFGSRSVSQTYQAPKISPLHVCLVSLFNILYSMPTHNCLPVGFSAFCQVWQQPGGLAMSDRKTCGCAVPEVLAHSWSSTRWNGDGSQSNSRWNLYSEVAALSMEDLLCWTLGTP